MIDLVGYRRYGHNEGDDPSFTQPGLYHSIQNHPRVLDIYANKLKSEGALSDEKLAELKSQQWKKLEDALEVAKKKMDEPKVQAFAQKWSGFNQVPADEEFFKSFPTAIDEKKVQELGSALITVPDSFNLHPKLKRFTDDRQKNVSR